jgi:hypothetical protein
LVYFESVKSAADGLQLAETAARELIRADNAELIGSYPSDGIDMTVDGRQLRESQEAPKHQFEVEEACSADTQKQTLSKIFRAWWLEIAAMILSTCSLLSVAIILFVNQNQPLSSWRVKYLPNSIMSQLMTITRSTLMLSTASCISQSCWLHMQQKPRNLFGIQLFDGASRGPAGAAMLLASQAGFSVLAFMGALITITTLLIESFTQQVIQYPLKTDIGTLNAYFPVTQVYAPAPLALDGKFVKTVLELTSSDTKEQC